MNLPNLPNVTKKASRREARAMLVIFTVLYAVVVLVHAGGQWLVAYESSFPVVCIGYGVLSVSWLLGLLVTIFLIFTLWDGWSDRKQCHRNGHEQTTTTSGVPFFPGVTEHKP